MKTKRIVLTGILGIALAGFIFTGCKKDKSTNPNSDSDITAAQDDANATNVSNDAQTVANTAVQSTGKSPFIFSTYYNATLTWARDTGAGDTIYIVFPSTPTECGDYKYRQGEIIVYWPKGTASNVWQAYYDSAITITELFRGYAVGGDKNDMYTVSGTRNWTNEGHNVSGYENWNFNANLTLTYPNGGGNATWSSNRVNVLTQVGGTWYYSITGTATGVTRENATYTLTITSPVYVTAAPWWAGGCAWPEAGTLNVNRSNDNATLTVNFGTLGQCSAIKTATLDGKNYTFSMW